MKSLKKFVTTLLALTMVAAFAVLASCATEKTYTLSYDGEQSEEYLAATLPVKPVSSSQMYTMVGITEVRYELTIKGDNQFSVYCVAVGDPDTTSNIYFQREYTIDGTYTESSENVYKLETATYVSYTLTYGTTYLAYESVFGVMGTTTSDEDSSLLAKFVACTATVSGDTVTFSA